MENGNTIESMGQQSTELKREIDMKGNGRMIDRKDGEKKYI